MTENIAKIVPHLPQGKVNNEIVGIAISMILDRSREDITIQGLNLLKNLCKSIGSTLVERYFYREILEIVAEETPAIGKIIIDIISEVFQCTDNLPFKEKILPIYFQFCGNENWNIRKQCVSVFPKLLKNSNKETQTNLLVYFIKFLKDKSKWVKELAVNLCGVVIINLQVIIPEVLIKNYFSVSDNGYYEAAFYFPAVFLTLGSSYWNEMKKLLKKLIDTEYKAQVSLIYSMHEIAKIAGSEISASEIIEIYDNFLEHPDLEFDAYTNLPNFLRELFPEIRDKYRPVIKNIGRNSDWRIRQIFAGTICEYIGVFDYNSIYAEIWPLALQLCEDDHSVIRTTAAKESAKLAMHLLSKNCDWKRHIAMCIKKYSKGSVNSRIVFLQIIRNFVGTDFAIDFADDVEILAKDPVDNVRIVCAETVAKSKNVWEAARIILCEDRSKDVRINIGNCFDSDCERFFITPPLLRNSHQVEIGGIVKFSHSLPMKFGKIENFHEYNNF